MRRPLKTKLLVLILALLVCNAARGLASRLAGGLALATATGLNALIHISGFDSLNSAHCNYSFKNCIAENRFIICNFITASLFCQVVNANS